MTAAEVLQNLSDDDYLEQEFQKELARLGSADHESDLFAFDQAPGAFLTATVTDDSDTGDCIYYKYDVYLICEFVPHQHIHSSAKRS